MTMISRLTISATLIVFLVISFLFSCCLVRCDSVKIWNLDSNRHEANKWLWDGSLCPQDRIIYPDETVIYIDKLVRNQQIVLPNNGEIVLDDNLDLIQANDAAVSDCEPVDRRFKLISGEWMDPMVWNQTLAGIVVSGSWANNPIPHVDRIPCTKDRIVFPKGFTFQTFVDFSENNLKVKSIQINGVTLNDQEFQSFIRSNSGRYVFAIPTSKTLTIDPDIGNDCDTGNGCSCDNRATKFVNRICKGVKCSPVNCVNPIKPEGHCCPLCGGLIKLTGISKVSDLSGFKSYFDNFWSTRYPGTVGYASISPQTYTLEIIITELEQSGLASRCVQHLYEDLSNDDNKLGLHYKSIEIKISNSSANESLPFFAVFLITVLIILIIFGFIMYRRRFGMTLTSIWNRSAFSNSQFTFIRFQGLDESERLGLELGLSNQPHSDEVTISSSSSKPILKSTSALFSISEEKVSIGGEISENVSTDESQDNQVELETDLEPRLTHDKALLLDVVSLEQD
ncbi:protein amnionless [Tetranychus urticae]|nr:protein amnionless [Tetranychus urticae]